MTRLFALMFAASMLAGGAQAGTPPEHLRGTLQAVAAHSVILNTSDGATLTVALTRDTAYALLRRSTAAAILPGSYIGAAAKGSGANMIALEVDIFPPALRDEGEGHHPWDPLADPSMPGSRSASTLTNGSVQTVSTLAGAKQVSLVYPGGKQIILVLPATPVVSTEPAGHAILQPGTHVFIFATNRDGKIAALRIIAGAGGITPPM